MMMLKLAMGLRYLIINLVCLGTLFGSNTNFSLEKTESKNHKISNPLGNKRYQTPTCILKSMVTKYCSRSNVKESHNNMVLNKSILRIQRVIFHQLIDFIFDIHEFLFIVVIHQSSVNQACNFWHFRFFQTSCCDGRCSQSDTRSNER